MKKCISFLLVLILSGYLKAQSWSAVGTTTLTGGRVLSLTDYNGGLFVGGQFTGPYTYCAYWTGYTWTPFGGGLGTGSGSWVQGIYASIVYKGELYLGGNFSASGINVKYLVRWNGVTWDSVGLGVNSLVESFAIYNGDLYVGGQFTTAGGAPANSIAKWDGKKWSSLSSGLKYLPNQTSCNALAVYNGDLYAGGYFDTAGGKYANCVAKWNGSIWDTVGKGLQNGTNGVFALDVYNGSLYAGGDFNFTSPKGNHVIYLSKWYGTYWDTVGKPLNGSVFCFKNYNGLLYMGGTFTKFASTADSCILSWNGTTMSHISGIGMSSGAQVDVLGLMDSTLYVGGFFTSTLSSGVTSQLIDYGPPTISMRGVVDLDNNANCKNDAGDVLVSGIGVKAIYNKQVLATVKTNNTGNYLFPPLPKQAYEIELDSNTMQPYSFVCPASGIINTDSSSNNYNFYTQCSSPGFDLTGTLGVCIESSTTSSEISACIYNNRCAPVNGMLELVHDSYLNVSSAAPNATHGDTLIWNFNNISPYSANYPCISFNTSLVSLPAGDSTLIQLIASPITGDSVPGNNIIKYWVKPLPNTCYGKPYDPNGKTVSPTGSISSNQLLTYTIHYQNTGTAIAVNVVVIDTLSPYLDPTTLKIEYSSFPVVVQMISGHIAKFIFNAIDLPNESYNPTGSIGTFTYTIMPSASVSIGDKIKNYAGVYFDNNLPVFTDTTLNVIGSVITAIQNIINPNHIAVFPNPFSSITSIIFNTNGKHYLEVDDITGRRIEAIECSGRQYELSRNGLAPGLYFIRSYDEGGNNIATAKIIVE